MIGLGLSFGAEAADVPSNVNVAQKIAQGLTHLFIMAMDDWVTKLQSFEQFGFAGLASRLVTKGNMSPRDPRRRIEGSTPVICTKQFRPHMADV